MTALSEPPITSETTDLALAERARTGDTEAFGELYSRYFTPIHDFVYRMVRNPQDAADVTQEAFLRALRSIEKLDEPGAVRGWLYTIARNTALNRLRVPVVETVERVPLGEDGDAAFDVVDPDAFADPAEAAEARAMSRLVWEAAAGLSVAEYTLLDLHVRHELGGAEIAKVLGTSPNSIYVRLNRARKTFERSVKALVLMQSGRESCERLARLLEERQLDRMSPEALRVIEDHAQDCDECDRRRGALLAPLTVFGALAPVAAMPGLHGTVLASLAAAGGAGVAAGGGAAAGVAGTATGTTGVAAGGAATGGIVGAVGATGMAIAAGVAMVAVVAAAFVLPISPISIGGGGGDSAPAAAIGEPTAVPTPTTQAVVPPPTDTPTAIPTPTATASPVVIETPSPSPDAPAAVPPAPSPGPAEEPSGVSTDPVDIATPVPPSPTEAASPAASPTAAGQTPAPSPTPAAATPEPPAPSPTAAATEPVEVESPTATPSPEPTEGPATVPSPTPTSEPSPTEVPFTPTPVPTSTPTPTSTAAPNLLFSVEAQGELPVLNVPFQLSATIENEGPGAAFDVTFEVPIPGGLTFLGLAAGGAPGVECAEVAGTLVCTVDEIGPGETVSVGLLMVMVGDGDGLVLEFTLPGVSGSEPIVVSLGLGVLLPGLALTAQFADDASQTVPVVRYFAENTGGIPLESVEIQDPDCASFVSVGDETAPLAPGETREFACAQPPTGEFQGAANAAAAGAAGPVTSASANYVVDLLPRVVVLRQVDPTELLAPGGGVAVRLVIANAGLEPLALLSANDSELGDAMEWCGFAAEIPAGGERECILRSRVTGQAGETFDATFTVVVADDEGNEGSAAATSTVAFTAPAPSFTYEFVTAFPYFEAQVAIVPFTATITNGGPGPLRAFGGTISGPGVSLVDQDCTGPNPIPEGETLECLLGVRITGAVGLERSVSASITLQREGQAPEVVTRQVTVTGCAGLGEPGDPECPWNDSDVEALVIGGVLLPGSVGTAFTTHWTGMIVPAIAFVAGLATLGLRRLRRV